MKLACCINAWDSIELLRYSMVSMRSRVDVFIIVFQNISNFGERYAPLKDMDLSGFNYVLKFYAPDPSLGGAINETNKRNIGIKAAMKIGCTHFILTDCDELYENFEQAVTEYEVAGTEGSVCKMYTYFRYPTLRFAEPDNYYVPFIHKLRPHTTSGHSGYPFYVDPTRRINCTDVVLIPSMMHHFSYVRRDIGRKCRNSSARVNIEKSNILTDYANARAGYFVKDFFNQHLVAVPNIFNIPEF